MTRSELRTLVRRRLNDTGTTFYTDADVNDALQGAYDDMSDATEWYERYANFESIDGHTYYDLAEILPDTLLSPRRVYNTTSNRWLDPTYPRELDTRTYVQWELNTGEPRSYFIRGNWIMGFWPHAASTTRNIRLAYTAIPAAWDADDDEPGFPQEFQFGIVEGALYRLFAAQRETKKALLHWNKYLDYETGLKDFVGRRQSLDRVGAYRG